LEIKTFLKTGQIFLKKFSQTPDLDCEIFLSEVLKKNREFLFTYPQKKITTKQKLKLEKFLEKRKRGFSVAAIIKKKEFFGINFLVNEKVLIPRLSTEILVEKILELSPKFQNTILIDVGTGCGNIAISAGKNFSFKKIIATDISKNALKLAKKNAQNNNLNIDFRHQNLLKKFPKKISGNFIFAANLPYLPKNLQNFSISQEPNRALFSGQDGFCKIKKFLQQLKSINFSAAILEFHPPQKQKIKKIIEKNFPQKKNYFFRDLEDFWRIAVIK